MRPKTTVITTYLGNWEDMSAGKEQALALVRRGADVIFQNADAAGLGVFRAVAESRGVYVIGSNSNQNGIAPEVTLGSVVIDVPHAFLLLAKEVVAGTFKARVVTLGTRDDVVRWEPNTALSSRIPAPALARIDSTRAAMRAGSFAMPGTAKP